MRLLLYIERFGIGLGGMEKQSGILAEYFSSNDCEVDILTFNYTGKDNKKRAPYQIISFRVPEISVLSKAFNFLFGFLYLLLNIKKYSLIMSFLLSSNSLLSGLFGKLFNIPVIFCPGGAGKTGDIMTSGETIPGKIKLFFIRKTANTIISPSAEIREELISGKFSADSVTVINNGVEINKFRPVPSEEKRILREKLYLPADKIIIIYSGRLHPNKGIQDLLRAFSKSGENSYLVIAGEGEEKNKIQELGSELGLENRIFFAGRVENIEEFYQASDIFVLPSYAEGMSNALLEGMSSGLLCVATRIGGTVEIIKDNENGFLYPPGEVGQLTAILGKLISEPAKYEEIKIKARETIIEKFDFNIQAEKYLRIIKNLCAESAV